MRLPYTRLIRDGNHFIMFTDGAWQGRWLLIDGPWFAHLEELSKSYHGRVWSVQMCYHGSAFAHISPDTCDPVACEIDQHIITWERIEWHPGSTISTRRADQLFGDRFAWVAERWYQVLQKRRQIGWWLASEGYQVPAYINHIDFIEDYFIAHAMPGTTTALAYSKGRAL